MQIKLWAGKRREIVRFRSSGVHQMNILIKSWTSVLCNDSAWHRIRWKNVRGAKKPRKAICRKSKIYQAVKEAKVHVIWHPSKQVRFKQITETLERQTKQTEQSEREQCNQACIHTVRRWGDGQETQVRGMTSFQELHTLRHFLNWPILSWSSPTEAGQESCVALWESITSCACLKVISGMVVVHMGILKHSLCPT